MKSHYQLIVSDPNVMMGKPVIAGTRITVELILEKLAAGEKKEVLELANSNGALLLTADRDFGELIFRQHLVSGGVILVRLAGLSAEHKAEIVSSALNLHRDELLGSFIVITPGLIPIRRNLHWG